jgi:predicted RNA-binding Zn ribbon-like protein
VRGLNAVTEREPSVQELHLASDGRLSARLRPISASAISPLLAGVIDELSELDPARLRRCARPECRLVFYDTTRSGTRRWHAERPCGVRERQRRHRAGRRSG